MLPLWQTAGRGKNGLLSVWVYVGGCSLLERGFVFSRSRSLLRDSRPSLLHPIPPHPTLPPPPPAPPPPSVFTPPSLLPANVTAQAGQPRRGRRGQRVDSEGGSNNGSSVTNGSSIDPNTNSRTANNSSCCCSNSSNINSSSSSCTTPTGSSSSSTRAVPPPLI